MCGEESTGAPAGISFRLTDEQCELQRLTHEFAKEIQRQIVTTYLRGGDRQTHG